jgi:hypothetical protein
VTDVVSSWWRLISWQVFTGDVDIHVYILYIWIKIARGNCRFVSTVFFLFCWKCSLYCCFPSLLSTIGDLWRHLGIWMFNPDGTFQREGTKHISPDRRQPSRRRSFPPTGHNRYLTARIDFLSVGKMVIVFVFQVELEMNPKSKPKNQRSDWKFNGKRKFRYSISFNISWHE